MSALRVVIFRNSVKIQDRMIFKALSNYANTTYFREIKIISGCISLIQTNYDLLEKWYSPKLMAVAIIRIPHVDYIRGW
jgi:hypothetical protein